ncbi:MAG: alpha/beta fold hydrolase [Candidatus Acidiferrales bacterium]
MKTWLRNIVLIAVGLVLLVVLCGVSYRAVEAKTDARRFPQQGKSVDIGGYKLNLNCTGQGSPTVVLETGFGVLSLTWGPVQSGIAKFARVCSYDRAGYGWSDSSPFPRTSAQIAKELHALLENAGEKPPYVLVGHSFGGLIIRVFNGDYPNDVAGIVLVESSHPDLLKLLPPAIKIQSDEAQVERERATRFAGIRFWLGITRFENRDIIDAPRVPYGERVATYLSIQPKYVYAIAGEGANLETSSEQAAASPTFGDKPLIVLTAGRGVLGVPVQDKDWVELQNIWINQLQVQLAELSTRGKRIMVDDSDHMIPLERPDAVISAAREVCAAVQPSH